jgi:hypothetical protein
MDVFFERGINGFNKNDFLETFQKHGLNPRFFEIVFNFPEVSLKAIEQALQKEYKGKKIIITSRNIKGKRQLGLNFDYHGVASELNGNLGIVSLNNETKGRIELIALHETLHLCGLAHCNSHGCIMAYKLCSSQLQYCLNCQHPCNPIYLCKKCKSGLNATGL